MRFPSESLYGAEGWDSPVIRRESLPVNASCTAVRSFNQENNMTFDGGVMVLLKGNMGLEQPKIKIPKSIPEDFRR